jgi:hypothetical protein
VGALLTVTAGFTSFICARGRPAAERLPDPAEAQAVVYTATVAFLFFFVNLSKWIPYAWLGLLDMRNLATSIVALLPLAPVGVFIGVRIARRINAVLVLPVHLRRHVPHRHASWCGMDLLICYE